MDDFALPLVPEDVDVETFYWEYMVKNRPALFDEALTRGWRSRQEWVSDTGAVNYDLLRGLFGAATVPVYDCSEQYYNSQPVRDMVFSEYLQYWEQYSSIKEGKCDYLKDWHFVRDFPAYGAYEVPKYFQSDWLNEFWAKRRDINDKNDYKFVYMGPAGSSSFSWSANICGKKRWIFVAPEKETMLRSLGDSPDQLPYDITDKLEDPEFIERFEPQVIVQRAGQVVFVPSGWIHQVINLEDTISINHNWFNASNIRLIWNQLELALRQVEHSLSDLRPTPSTECDFNHWILGKENFSTDKEGETDHWTEECQTLLKAHHGMNCIEFLNLLQVIADRLMESTSSQCDDHWLKKHEVFTLRDLLNDMLKKDMDKSLKIKVQELCSLLSIIIQKMNS